MLAGNEILCFHFQHARELFHLESTMGHIEQAKVTFVADVINAHRSQWL